MFLLFNFSGLPCYYMDEDRTLHVVFASKKLKNDRFFQADSQSKIKRLLTNARGVIWEAIAKTITSRSFVS